MEKNVLETIEGVAMYPVISLIIFVLFFAVIVIWMFKTDKGYIMKMASLPLDEEQNTFEVSNLENKKSLKG